MQLRKAVPGDVPAIHRLVNEYAAQGIMLRRTVLQLYQHLREFTVACTAEGQIVGVGALALLWHDLAEVRSLAVEPGMHGQGVGRAVVEALVNEAETMGLARVFALTYQQSFFERLGFQVVKKETLPQKVWTDCVVCPKFHACDEIAVIRWLREPGPDDAAIAAAVQAVAEAAGELPVPDIPDWIRG